MWKDLSLREKADLIRLGVQNGVKSITQIREMYDASQNPDNPPTFEEYYRTIPSYKNDTTHYNLKRAYELLPYQEMKNFAEDDQAHLPSVAYDEATDTYEFLKDSQHPTLHYELDWYNSDDPEAVDFRSKYRLDTTGRYYKYLPR